MGEKIQKKCINIYFENLVVARYSGEGREDHFPELCRDVVSTKPDVIVTAASGLVLSFKATTDSIPIVASMADPVSYGIVASLARPGGNITGVAVGAGLEIWGKRLQVLHEAVPTASRVGFLASRLSSSRGLHRPHSERGAAE
jgi:putative ABC transport system substrate-binding protein